METDSVASFKKALLESADKDILDLSEIASLVKSGCNLKISIENPKHTALRICGQDGTVYAGNEVQHKAWKEFYLPEKMEMGVIGNPKHTALRICGQDGTVYAGNEVQLKAWKEFYLPEKMEMEVIGAVDNFPCDAFGQQLVVLLCENRNVYAYEDEVLHLVAKNLMDLFKNGICFPGQKTFKLGKCFKELTAEEYNTIMKSEEIKTMRKTHQMLRESIDGKLLNTLNMIKQRRKNHLQVQNQRDSITSSTDKIVQEKETSGNYKQTLCTEHRSQTFQQTTHLCSSSSQACQLILEDQTQIDVHNRAVQRPLKGQVVKV